LCRNDNEAIIGIGRVRQAKKSEKFSPAAAAAEAVPGQDAAKTEKGGWIWVLVFSRKEAQ
jgi:hypothetical protein